MQTWFSRFNVLQKPASEKKIITRPSKGCSPVPTGTLLSEHWSFVTSSCLTLVYRIDSFEWVILELKWLNFCLCGDLSRSFISPTLSFHCFLQCLGCIWGTGFERSSGTHMMHLRSLDPLTSSCCHLATLVTSRTHSLRPMELQMECFHLAAIGLLCIILSNAQVCGQDILGLGAGAKRCAGAQVTHVCRFPVSFPNFLFSGRYRVRLIRKPALTCSQELWCLSELWLAVRLWPCPWSQLRPLSETKYHSPYVPVFLL